MYTIDTVKERGARLQEVEKMRITVFTTEKKVEVYANSAILFETACALEQPVYMTNCSLTVDRKESTLSIVHKTIELNTDIDFIEETQQGRIKKFTYHCFE